MSAPLTCPVCATKLQPDWESCPNCPMSFRDAPPQKTALESDVFRNFGLPILIFGGCVYFVWTLGAYMLRTAEESTKTPLKAAKKTAPLSDVAVPGAGELELTPYVPVTAKSPSEYEVQTNISVMLDKGAGENIVSEWRMRGGVYDLITLKPVPIAYLFFTDTLTNSRVQINTDSSGRYRALLAPLSGRAYVVTLEKAGYEATYLDPGIKGVWRLPLERRRELAKDPAALISKPFVFAADSDKPRVVDFYLSPK